MRLKYSSTPNLQAKTSFVWLSLAFLVFIAWSFSPFAGVRAQGSPGTLSFAQAAINVNESAGSATITVTRSGGTDGAVTAKVSLADGTTTPADYRFNPGALDPAFVQVPQASFLYYQTQIALQPDGKLLVASNHTVFRVNSDGSPDPTFTTAALNGGCSAIALQSDDNLSQSLGAHETTRGVINVMGAMGDGLGAMARGVDNEVEVCGCIWIHIVEFLEATAFVVQSSVHLINNSIHPVGIVFRLATECIDIRIFIDARNCNLRIEIEVDLE